MAVKTFTIMYSDGTYYYEDYTYSTSATATNITITITKVAGYYKGKSGESIFYPAKTVHLMRNAQTNVLSIPLSSGTFISNGAKVTRFSGTKTVTLTKTHSSESLWLDSWDILLNIPAKTTYKVSFNANGGSGAPAAQTKWHGETLVLSNTKPSRTGYTFQKWNTKADGSGTNYNPGANYTGNAALTLYAQWKINTYTVSYNANGGSGAPSSQTKTYGKTLTLSSTKPTWTGRIFQGWATSSTGVVKYSAGGSYTANAGATLYAVWKLITYTVSYNANDGSGAPSSQTKTYGQTLTLSSTKPSRTGYTFQKWNTKADGSGTNYNSGANYTGNAALSLYAQWKINTWTVSYNANGGSGAPSSQTKTYGQTLTLSSTKPTKTGYKFKGWSTTASGIVKYQPGGAYITNAAATLYAVWEQTYFAPTISKLTATRTIKRNDSYVEDSEGTYAHVKFTWANGTYEGDPVVPTAAFIGIREQGTSGAYVETEITLDSNIITIYIENPQVEQPKAYDIRVRFTVDGWSDVIKTTYITKAYFIMDINADGTAIAFGAEASDEPPYYMVSKWSMMIDRKSGDYFSDNNAMYYARSNRSGNEVKCGVGVGSGGTNHGVYSYSPENKWLICFDANHDVRVGGPIHLGASQQGLFLVDSKGFEYPLGYDNGTNLWIGAKQRVGQHHTGQTIISTGHNGTSGNETMYVCVPNAGNTDGTSYPILHSGYKPTTPSISVSASTGTLNSATARQYGKVVQLVLNVKNSNSIAAGSNVFEGSLDTSALRPCMTARGCGFLGNNVLMVSITAAGVIIVRNAVPDALPANTEAVVGMTYLIS